MTPKQIAIKNKELSYEGTPCRKVGHTTRYTSGECVECKKEYQQKNKDKISKQKAQTYQDNREEKLKQSAEYYANNKEKVSQYNKGNRENINKRERARYRNDPVWRLKRNLSRLFRYWCKQVGSSKGGRTLEELVGYTKEEFHAHIESLFQEGMIWDNAGEWHVDHIIPASHFTSIDQMKECFALSNLKPEWGEWNRWKNDRFVGSSEEFPMPTKAA